MAEAVDVCVVGSGAGGGPLALALAEAGLGVVVLEKGEAHRPSDYVHDELRVVRRDFFMPFVSDEPHVRRASASEPGRRTSFGWIACCVGGGTAHWSGFAHRLSPRDFRRATDTGGIAGASLADWPIRYEDLEPYYAKAEREIGVSGVAVDGPQDPPRSAPFPLPPLAAHPLGELVDRAATELGLSALRTPMAILSQPYGGRAGCMYCELCGSYGCEMGAKGSTAVALLPRAVATGRCEIRPRSMAIEIAVDEHGRAASVVYLDAKGARREQRARLVVVACSAIESARLLLRSKSARSPAGLANSSGLVGKNLMMVTLGRGRADFLFGGRSGLARLDAGDPFVGRTIRDPRGAPGSLGFELMHPSPIFVAERLSTGPGGKALWGAALKDRLRKHYREGKHLELEAFSECLPVATNAVDLSPDVVDRHGLPAARLTFSHHPADLDASARLVEAGRSVFEAMRPDRIEAVSSGATFDVLQSGTCRFGDDPRSSVLDRECRAHDVPNLYVVDGSFMPTSGSVPPTLTIMANSFRVADAIVARAKRGEIP